MDHTLRELYPRYLRAVEFFNAQIERKYASEETRAIFRQQALSEEVFPSWWMDASKDLDLKRRWLERFEDPAGYFARTCQRISEELNRIPIQTAAA